MVDIQRTFTVAKPITDVVAYLADFAHAESWDPGTTKCEPVNSDPVAVGKQWNNTSEIKGHETELLYTLTRQDADHLTFVGENKGATSTDSITFAAEGERTTITYHSNIEFHGVAKVAGLVAKPIFEKLGDETVEKMTATLEAL